MFILRILVVIFLLLLGVFLIVGLGGVFWINFFLIIFGFYIVGIVYVIWVIVKYDN